MAEGTIDKWEFTRDYAVATLDGGTTAEVRLRRQDGNGNTAEPPVIKNLRYFGVPRNDGFVLMPNEIQAYRVSPREVRDQPCHPCHICWVAVARDSRAVRVHPAVDRVGTLTGLDRYRGALLGLAAGDALGTTLEFTTPGAFTPITDMAGGGPFDLGPGEWTDDTSMALCLAESLLECGAFDPVDQLAQYVRWKRTGHHSSTGRCFDIGGTVLTALARFERFSDPWSGSTEPFSAGNGSIMRLAPVPLFFAHDPELAISNAAMSSRTTHGHPEAIDACRYLAGLIVGALQGRTKEDLLLTRFSPLPGLWTAYPLVAPIARVANGSYLQEEPPVIRGDGYVTRSLEAALWAFAKSTCFKDGALLAVNLGEDADTTGAVYGQLAGAYYGVESIPFSWRLKLAKLKVLESFATRLYQAAESFA